jgi:hypothetical protein
VFQLLVDELNFFIRFILSACKGLITNLTNIAQGEENCPSNNKEIT